MSFLDNADKQAEKTPMRADSNAVLAREAGVPFQPQLNNTSGIDPIVEWLSLMEVVQMLCPVWPVRDSPIRGDYWRL
jgi:hypothetical protein